MMNGTTDELGNREFLFPELLSRNYDQMDLSISLYIVAEAWNMPHNHL
jgi:hypothetical protein